MRHLCIILLIILCMPHIGKGAEGDQFLVVGGDRNYPPYEFLDETGAPNGYNVELTRAIAEVMGMEVRIVLGDWGEMRRALAQGDVDILQGVAFLDERKNELDFSPPHTVVFQSIWVRTGSPIADLDDIGDREVIVMRGSVMHDFMRARGHQQLRPVDTLADALQLLARGEGACALVAKLPGQYIVHELGIAGIEPLAQPFAEQPYGYAVRKGNLSTLARFNEGLAILKRSGRYQEIHNRWLGVLDQPGIPWGKVLKAGLFVVVPLLIGLGGMLIWSRSLKGQVAIRTKALQQEVLERQRAVEELEIRQRQLIQADKMTSLGILVSGVAHEVNNPNGLILLNLPQLQRAFNDALPLLEEKYRTQGDFRLGWLNYSRMREEIPVMLDETMESARKIKRIVQDLKDFARQDDSSLKGVVDINRLVEASVRLAEPSIRKATDRFSQALGEDLPPVLGNAQRIEQVIVNLLLNATQALRSKDEAIRVCTRLDESGDWLCVEVDDEGCGVEPDQMPFLTDPFYTTNRETGGTGLGLSVSATIVKDHRGELLFASEPHKGMTVTLKLPCRLEQPHA